MALIFFYILFLFDFINKNSMFLISMFLCFASVQKLVPRTVAFHWYRYRILKFWYRDNNQLNLIGVSHIVPQKHKNSVD